MTRAKPRFGLPLQGPATGTAVRCCSTEENQPSVLFISWALNLGDGKSQSQNAVERSKQANDLFVCTLTL